MQIVKSMCFMFNLQMKRLAIIFFGFGQEISKIIVDHEIVIPDNAIAVAELTPRLAAYHSLLQADEVMVILFEEEIAKCKGKHLLSVLINKREKLRTSLNLDWEAFYGMVKHIVYKRGYREFYRCYIKDNTIFIAMSPDDGEDNDNDGEENKDPDPPSAEEVNKVFKKLLSKE